MTTSSAAVGYGTGITPTETHVHSMVQLFLALGEDERAAFAAYADAHPDDCLLLVDTVDTLGSAHVYHVSITDVLAGLKVDLLGTL